MTLPVFIFVGFSGSGKTTFVEQLVSEFTQRGLRVATIKNAHHKVQLDTPGKDSWRYKQAGAALSMLVSNGQFQLVGDAPCAEPIQLAQQFLGAVDLVLAEGFSSSQGLKIEVLRRANQTPPRCNPSDNLIALVSDMDEIYPELPHFALDDVAGLADFLWNGYGQHS